MGKKKKKKSQFSSSWHGGAVSLKGLSPEKTKEKALEASEMLGESFRRSDRSLKKARSTLNYVKNKFASVDNEREIPELLKGKWNEAQQAVNDAETDLDHVQRRLVQMDHKLGITPEERELMSNSLSARDRLYTHLFDPGTERDLTGAAKLTNVHPVGSTFKTKDGTVYEVATDDFNQAKTRFLDWLIDYGAKCSETMEHYQRHPDSKTTFVRDNEVIEYPFKDLTKAEQNNMQIKHLWWAALSDALSEPGNYKRLRLDAEQAKQFAEMATGPDKNMQGILHTPFPSFYMEFTDPITIGDQDPNDDGSPRHDEVLALIYDENELTPNPESHGVLSFLLREKDTQEVSYRSFVMDLAKGRAITPVETATNYSYDPSVVPALFANLIDPQGEKLLIALNRASGTDRYAGYWERAIAKYAEFFSWIILYTVAKGIEIVEEPLPRSERRRMARASKKGELPEPWQIVRVEPTVVRKYENRQAGSPDKVTHGYRYDVRGHLRKGKHKLRDGSYRYTVEWVPAHQRGLKHELYIPKVHQYSGEMDDKFIPEEE